jgi:hypothetical protein
MEMKKAVGSYEEFDPAPPTPNPPSLHVPSPSLQPTVFSPNWLAAGPARVLYLHSVLCPPCQLALQPTMDGLFRTTFLAADTASSHLLCTYAFGPFSTWIL